MDILEKIEKKKIKGYLTINRRIIFEGAIYHITQRAPGRELLFPDESDYLYFLKLLKETVKKFNLELFAFALISNHLHLLLKINEKNLSSAMKNLFERYADYFNNKYKRKGHVFCGRYRAGLCNDDNYFLAISLYIHLNPYRAGLCRTFENYRWSSLNLYIATPKKTFVNFEQILSFLDPDIDKAKERYLEMLKESIDIKGNTLQDGSSIKAHIKDIVKKIKKTVSKKDEEEDLCKIIGEFKSKRRTTNIKAKKAKKYLIEQLLANGYSTKEITQMLSIGRATFYRIMPLNETKQARLKMSHSGARR